MATPIIESIALDVVAAINAITTGNGFNQDLTAVRPRKNDWSDLTPVDKHVFVKQADPERRDADGLGTIEWEQPFTLSALVLDADAATDSIDTRINQVRSDIEKKMREDPTRGGNAYDTRIAAPVQFDDGIWTGIEVNIIVLYRTNENDPFTIA